MERFISKFLKQKIQKFELIIWKLKKFKLSKLSLLNNEFVEFLKILIFVIDF
jgi:hypothetical protein